MDQVMIDAIGTMLQGSSTQRVDTEQPVLRSAQQDADPRTTVSQDSEASRFYSPVVRLDPETQRTVLQYRDANSGKVVMQYPSEKQLEAYRNRAAAEIKGEASGPADEAISPTAAGSEKGSGGYETAGNSQSNAAPLSPFAPARPASGRSEGVPAIAVPSIPAAPVVTSAAADAKPQMAVVA
jgi:hypothetical protein